MIFVFFEEIPELIEKYIRKVSYNKFSILKQTSLNAKNSTYTKFTGTIRYDARNNILEVTSPIRLEKGKGL